MLLWRVGAPSFSLLCRIPLCKCTTVFWSTHLLMDNLGCFQHLAIVNCAAMNMGVCCHLVCSAAQTCGRGSALHMCVCAEQKLSLVSHCLCMALLSLWTCEMWPVAKASLFPSPLFSNNIHHLEALKWISWRLSIAFVLACKVHLISSKRVKVFELSHSSDYRDKYVHTAHPKISLQS